MVSEVLVAAVVVAMGKPQQRALQKQAADGKAESDGFYTVTLVLQGFEGYNKVYLQVRSISHVFYIFV